LSKMKNELWWYDIDSNRLLERRAKKNFISTFYDMIISIFDNNIYIFH
jgi:hypothetical protein